MMNNMAVPEKVSYMLQPIYLITGKIQHKKCNDINNLCVAVYCKFKQLKPILNYLFFYNSITCCVFFNFPSAVLFLKKFLWAGTLNNKFFIAMLVPSATAIGSCFFTTLFSISI